VLPKKLGFTPRQFRQFLLEFLLEQSFFLVRNKNAERHTTKVQHNTFFLNCFTGCIAAGLSIIIRKKFNCKFDVRCATLTNGDNFLD